MVTIQYYKLMERNIDYFNLRKYILSSLQGRGWGWVLFSLFIVLTACHRNNDDHTAVRKAAEQYYGYLAKGDVDRYMRGLADYDSLPESYRRELRDMFLQYLDREQQSHRGILSAEAVRDTLVDSLHAHVFLNIQFGDSTIEQVSLPLVRTAKGWRMR